MTLSRTPLAEDVLRRFAAAVRAGQLYSPDHPIVERSIQAFGSAVNEWQQVEPSLVIGIVQQEIIVGDVPMGNSESYAGLVRRLKPLGVERVVIEPGASTKELAAFITALGSSDGRAIDGGSLPPLPHIRVGRVSTEAEDHDRSDGSEIARVRRAYKAAVSAASIVWNSALTERKVDATAAQAMVAGLADAVSENQSVLVALTTLKNADDYTFTHMVNVSILMMGQARGLGIDGPLLQQFGLAGLMHDIGKVRTPADILNKPSSLTDDEVAILRRHPLDGAAILRATPEVPALAAIVAYEHHYRLDGSGYPAMSRARLNLATSLCSIADVFDAMRSQRQYQQAYPSERILAVLRERQGARFDPFLVRRFVQLIGIYPVGTTVRLDTGHIAVVVAEHEADPSRPQVRILSKRDGTRLEHPFEVNLWQGVTHEGEPRAIVAPIDSTPSTSIG